MVQSIDEESFYRGFCFPSFCMTQTQNSIFFQDGLEVPQRHVILIAMYIIFCTLERAMMTPQHEERT